MVEFNLCRIIIKGHRVQGVNLRNMLKQFSNSKKYLGKVKNLESGEVEVIYLLEGKKGKDFRKEVETFLSRQDIAEFVDVSNIDEAEVFFDRTLGEKIKKKGEFFIEKADDLTEMVWALKGAGNVFVKSAEKVDKLLSIKTQEVNSRLISMLYELNKATDKNWKVEDLFCMKQFIANPMIEDENLIHQLIDYYYFISDFFNIDNIDDKDRNEIKKRTENIAKILDNAIKQNKKSINIKEDLGV